MSEKQSFHAFLAVLGTIIILAIAATVAVRVGRDATVYVATIASMTTLAAAFKPRSAVANVEKANTVNQGTTP